MTSTYRERDRHDDSRSYVSTRRDEGDRYTKVTRYIIREDDDARSNHTSNRRDSPERETIRITRRTEVDDRDTVASPRRSVAPTFVEKDLVIRGSTTEKPRSPRPWERRDDATDREVVIRRTEERDDGYRREADRGSLVVSRVEDRRESDRHDYDVYRTGEYGRDRDLQHYTRTAEYYGPPNQQPQTIIIRQDPIIIRERVRDDDYQLVKRNDDDRSVATTRRDDRDEEYFYEKRVREQFDGYPDDDYDRRSRRELSPGDSISQAGALTRGRQSRGRSSYSDDDDSIVYVKRVEKEYSRSSSRDRGKDLAAGAIAGVGAAELLRNHKKKEGKEASHGIGRIGRDVGAGAIGAIAAEGIRRYRSKSRHGSRSRSGSRDRYSRRDHRDRSRSRSGSRPSLKTLGALGLGAAAVAAAASIATRKMNENKKAEKDDRRSRSRRRRSSRGSVESLEELENDPTAKDARNPQHRNSRIAAAGAVGAAGAALIERARSKSRGEGSRERSQSRLRQGIPVALTGLGTAALAGWYEKNKAKHEAEEIQKKQKARARSRSRSTNRRSDRSDSQYDDRSRGVDPNLVEYGYGDVSGNNYGPEYYGRAPPQEPYYANTTAVVPASRTRSRSRSVSRDRRGMRSRSVSSGEDRKRIAAGSVAGAGAGAAVASEYERRKAEKRERKARKRAQEAGRDPYEEAYPPQQTPQPPWTPPPADPYASYQGFGGPQNQSQFPPPPGSVPAGLPNQYQPPYQPVPAPTPVPAATGRYTPQTAHTPQPPYNAQAFAPPPPPQSAPPPHQGYGEPYGAGAVPPYGQQPRSRGPDENVSAGNLSSQYTPPNNDQHPLDGVSNTRSLDPAPIPPPPPTPAIQVHPPTGASTPSLFIPNTYVPPAERPGDLPSDDQGTAKSVSFAPSPEKSRAPDPESSRRRRSSTLDSDSISPDSRRERRRQQDASRGYEAGDDTDLSPNTERRASKHGSNRDQSYDRAPSSSSRRERNSDRSLNTEEDDNNERRERRRERRSSRSDAAKGRDPSPTGSDATIDLPARFDERGRKKAERGDDPLADKIDDILQGKGSAGKVFGNVLDGIFGRDTKPRGGYVDEGNSR